MMTRSAIRLFAAAACMALAVFAAPSQASDVALVGVVDGKIQGDSVEFDIPAITNYSSTATAALRVELWAFAGSPYSGLGLYGHRIATYDVAPIAGNQSLLNTVVEVPLYGPPKGDYYLALVLTEYTGAAGNDGYTQRWYANRQGLHTLHPTIAPPVAISPQVGLWWNPAESGSGYAFDFKHGTLVVTVYSYKADGTPLWYIVSGPVTGNSFTGALNRTTGGQCISCAYVTPVLAGNDGTMSIVFSSAVAGTMTLPGGRVIPVVPQDF